ncbi:MAG: PAS domain-containing protein [Actinomycetia bacterium]|nr:PAS domain-containing protein [Actinomycetes bacterium]
MATESNKPQRTQTSKTGAPVGPEPAIRVVAVGSSAGGLDALSELLAGLPTDLAVAYVVAQHMSPDHDSHLVELLSQATDLRVLSAKDGASLVSGVVLVAPPHSDVVVGKESVSVSAPGSSAGPKPSIDVLMRSVAESWGEQGIGIVLSGTGSDGSAGLRRIRDAGGLSIAQLPESAQFDAMPKAAIAAGAVDLILAPAAMGPALSRTPTALFPGTAPSERVAPTPGGTDVVADVVAALRFSSGLDFADYKRGTLERQIARRQALIDCTDPSAYCAMITQGSQEADALARALLVTVTSFFRDRQAWQALHDVLTDAWQVRDSDRPIRVWVPGCATGEEAYTAAMVVADVLGAGANIAERVKVFATDLSDAALDIARRGHYSDDATAAIPDAYRERWMRRSGMDWRVLPELRDAVVFARHNVAQDPPFPRIDLVSLRNTLIYFNAPLQTRALSFCHFALVPGGFLILGQSERPTGTGSAFSAVDEQFRIYQRSTVDQPAPLPVPAPEPEPAKLPRTAALSPPTDQRLVLRDQLVNRFSPPALVLDGNDDVIEVIGDVSPWCWVAPGQPSTNVIALVREELRVPVRSLLIQARYRSPEQEPRSELTPEADTRIEASQLGPAEAEWVLLTFNPIDPTPKTESASEPTARGDGQDDAELALVRAELEQTRAALQATTEDLSASNEELRAMNEELQASAEELQASGEEVQATNEELQATNEELTVLNTELRERSAELAAVNDRMENIQGSLASGMIVVDTDLRVRSFTPLAVRLFVLIDADLGRPITEIQTTTQVPDLTERLHSTIENGTRSMLELPGQSADYLVAFQPHLQDTRIVGAIVVITDITDLVAARNTPTDNEE